MTTWLDPDRACSCHLCAPNRADDGCLDRRDTTAALVQRHGWSVTGIDAADGVPAWACTVGLWHSLGSPELAPFTGVDARTTVFTLHRVVAGGQVRGVVRDDDGSWQFLDGAAFTRADIAIAHLHHVLARQPHVRDVADLGPGEQAWLDGDGTWQRGRPAGL